MSEDAQRPEVDPRNGGRPFTTSGVSAGPRPSVAPGIPARGDVSAMLGNPPGPPGPPGPTGLGIANIFVDGQGFVHVTYTDGNTAVVGQVVSTIPGEQGPQGPVGPPGAPWRAPVVRVYQTPGPGSWSKPAGLVGLRVRGAGGGGGSGGAGAGATASHRASGGGGGAGGYFEKWYRAEDLNATEAFTVGTGGLLGAGATYAAGGPGGATTFKGCTANGGGGGGGMAATTANAGGNAGVGGTASGGDVNVQGGDGGSSSVYGGANQFTGRGGANSLSGGELRGVLLGGTQGYDGRPFGGGASGPAAAGTVAQSGRVGGIGGLIFEEFY